MPTGESKTSPRRIEAKERVTKALRLRRSGANYEDIAVQCGYNSPQAAQKAVAKEIRDMPADEAEEMRALIGDRQDRMIFALWGKAIKGDERAIDRVIAIDEKRAKLFGLNAPTKIAETDADGNDKPESGALDALRRAIERAARRRAGGSPQPTD
jgi:AraC-like DNA-binding protein